MELSIAERFLSFISIYLPFGVVTVAFEVVAVWIVMGARPKSVKSSKDALVYLLYWIVFWPGYWFWFVFDVFNEYKRRNGR